MEQLIERAAGDLVDSKHAIALTGAGISDYLIQGKTGELLPRMVERVKAKLG
jgi:hypothetical protein